MKDEEEYKPFGFDGYLQAIVENSYDIADIFGITS